MARLRGFPPVVLPCDRVTLHEWVWTEEAADARARDEFGPVLAEVAVAAAARSVTFPVHVGEPYEAFIVTWSEGKPIRWTGPTNRILTGDSVSFGPLPDAGTLVDAGGHGWTS